MASHGPSRDHQPPFTDPRDLPYARSADNDVKSEPKAKNRVEAERDDLPASRPRSSTENLRSGGSETAQELYPDELAALRQAVIAAIAPGKANVSTSSKRPPLEELRLDEPNKIGYVYKCLGSALVSLRLAMRQTAEANGPLIMETCFEEVMVDLIMEGGDADTNGAAAGALLGAYLGYAKLPSHWTLGLAHRDWLVHKTGRLIIAAGIMKEDLRPEKDEAFDGGVGLLSEKELEHRWALLVADMSMKMNAARNLAKRDEKKRGIAGWFAN